MKKKEPKLVTCREIDDAHDSIIQEIVGNLLTSGSATRHDIDNFLQAQSNIHIGLLEELFDPKDVKDMLNQKKEELLGKSKTKKERN